MSATVKNKRTFTVEDLESGGIRVTVVGTPFLVPTSAGRTLNMSTSDITHVYLSDFAPAAGEDRAAYSAKHCTDDGMLHGPNGCDGVCHDFKCLRSADVFVSSKDENGQSHCIPFCKFHGHGMCDRVGRAVLMALDFGVIEDIRFWTLVDPLPSGLPRCCYYYYAIDEWGDSERARCTRPAAKRARVIMSKGETIDAELCAQCASSKPPSGATIEILGDLPTPATRGTEDEGTSQSPFQTVDRWTEEHMKRYLATHPATHGEEYSRIWRHIWQLVGYGEDSWHSHYEFAVEALEDHGPGCLDACMSCSQMEYGFAKLIVKVYEATHGLRAWINPQLPVEDADSDTNTSSVSEG